MALFSSAINSAYTRCISLLPAKYYKLDEIASSADYSGSGKEVRLQAVREEIELIKSEAYNSINEAYDSYVKRLELKYSSISGKDIENADFKLLKENLIRLNQQEFEIICMRHKGNVLMMKSLEEYSMKNDHLRMPYEVYSKEAKLVKAESARRFFCENIRTCAPIRSTKGKKLIEVRSFDYENYIEMNGFKKLDEICCE